MTHGVQSGVTKNMYNLLGTYPVLMRRGYVVFSKEPGYLRTRVTIGIAIQMDGVSRVSRPIQWSSDEMWFSD